MLLNNYVIITCNCCVILYNNVGLHICYIIIDAILHQKEVKNERR